ncbi:MAG: HlyD family type I secretion periplasmic adaptor subunit [Rhodospirillales bacterium]|jgi:adhesin transport system membrane fusion protein|nr:HlyD family type I secretion periplasmic adaptor subunit [Rhodospirillales bacterium]
MKLQRLEALVASHPLPSWRPIAWTVMGLLGSFVLWSIFAHLDEVAIAQGEVVPYGKVKLIQHLEGGVLREMSIQEGQIVHEGAPLFTVDLPASAINKEELQVRLDGAVLQRARLEAEARGEPLSFPNVEAARQPVLRQAEENTYESRFSEHRSTMAKIVEQVRQRELDVQEMESRRRSSQANMRIAEEKLSMSKNLLKDGLTPRMEHLQVQRDVETLQGEIAQLESAVPRAKAALSEAINRQNEEEQKYRREAREQLATAELTVARTRELLSQASDQALRSQVNSPIDGIVKNLRYNTIGGVIKPGDTVMELVPLKDKLVIEAKLNPIDRGYVEAGQKALVKVSTYDFARYGGLYGKVSLVAADSTIDQNNGSAFFRVVAETDKSYLGDEEGILPITPGMQATVEIHTGTKTVMEYLIKPVIKLKHEAFRER